MKIKSLQLKNFKRFTDLTLQGIPESARLVLLIGSNGSGKSSIFDSFEFIASQNEKYSKSGADDNRKDKSIGFEISIETYDFGKEGLSSSGLHRSNKLKSESFYGRTSFRQVPRITRTQLGARFVIASDSDRPISFIDRDERFENDLEHIFGQLLKDFFRSADDKSEIKQKVINPINTAFDNIFNKENGTKLELLELIPPLEGKIAEINFKKGNTVFHYNYLSAGEKEVFNILINLVARGEYYKNTVFFYDEIDLHLNTNLQFNFLKELIENWIPENCQFWTASHSLGFIEYARKNELSVIFDFDDFDFDYPKILSPIPKDNPDVYEIAVGKDILPSLFKDYKLIFVENKDKNYYGEVTIDNVLFVQENGKHGVYHKAKNGQFYGLVDRDFLTDSDITLIETAFPTLKILRFYSIENYLYHPDNLLEYYKSKSLAFDREAYINGLVEEKNKALPELRRKLALVRTEYPYFKEPEYNGKANQNRFKSSNENLTQVAELEEYLHNNNPNVFYKVFPMKDHATQLKERQNIAKSDLAKTKWFKEQIELILEPIINKQG